MNFTIAPLDETLRPLIQAKIDAKTKPLGALGQLESLALQMCLVQQRLDPQINAPHLVVLRAITGRRRSRHQRLSTIGHGANGGKFLQGGAAINGFVTRRV